MHRAGAVAAHDAVVQAIAEVNIPGGVPGGSFDKGHDTHGSWDSRCKQFVGSCLVNLTDLLDQCADHERCLEGPEGAKEQMQGLTRAVDHAGCLHEEKRVVQPTAQRCGCNRVARDGRMNLAAETRSPPYGPGPRDIVGRPVADRWQTPLMETPGKT